jgi:hypothetical protein
VQNFNEQTCILILGGGYALLTGLGLDAYEALTGFGLLVASMMWFIKRWHEKNWVHHGPEMNRLLDEVRAAEQKD